MKRIADQIEALQIKYQLLVDEQRLQGYRDRSKEIVGQMGDALHVQYHLQEESESRMGPGR